MKQPMKFLESAKKVDQESLVRVMGRVDPELFEKARPVMKKHNITWNTLIESSLRKIIKEDKEEM